MYTYQYPNQHVCGYIRTLCIYIYHICVDMYTLTDVQPTDKHFCWGKWEVLQSEEGSFTTIGETLPIRCWDKSPFCWSHTMNRKAPQKQKENKRKSTTLQPNWTFDWWECNYQFQLLLSGQLMHCTLSSCSVKIGHNLGNRTQLQFIHYVGTVLFLHVLIFQLLKSYLFYKISLEKVKVSPYSVSPYYIRLQSVAY